MTSEDDPYVMKPDSKEFEGETLSLSKFLNNLVYPVTKENMIEKAKKLKMADEMVQFLKKISHRTYVNASDVMDEIVEGTETL